MKNLIKRRSYNIKNWQIALSSQKSDTPIGNCNYCGSKKVPIHQIDYTYNIDCDCCNPLTESKHNIHTENVYYCNNCNSLPPVYIRIYKDKKYKIIKADKYFNLKICKYCNWSCKDNGSLKCNHPGQEEKYTVESQTCNNFILMPELKNINSINTKLI